MIQVLVDVEIIDHVRPRDAAIARQPRAQLVLVRLEALFFGAQVPGSHDDSWGILGRVDSGPTPWGALPGGEAVQVEVAGRGRGAGALADVVRHRRWVHDDVLLHTNFIFIFVGVWATNKLIVVYINPTNKMFIRPHMEKLRDQQPN